MATLEKFGHKPTVVENGVQVLTQIDKDNYDLILMDIRMPEMSGPETTRAIRARTDALAKIPIIALTVDAMEEHIQGYLADGMDACATKPIDRAKLLTTINEVLGEEIPVADAEDVDSRSGHEMDDKASGAEADHADDDKSTACVLDFLNQIDGVAEDIERTKKTKS